MNRASCSRQLKAAFRRRQAVREVSHPPLRPGTIFGGFLGTNGAGKTTTIRMLCGQRIRLAGRRIAAHNVWQGSSWCGRNSVTLRSVSSCIPISEVGKIFAFGGACRMPLTWWRNEDRELCALADLEEKRDTRREFVRGGMRQLLLVARRWCTTRLALSR